MTLQFFTMKAYFLRVPVLRQTIRRCFGQPVHQTHPHIMAEDEVTPGISKHEYSQRRSKLWQSLLKEDHNTVAIIPSSSKVYMGHEVPYPFRQDTDFLYLSGFQEPDSILILTNIHHINKSNTDAFSSLLFVPKRDERRELWDGPRTGSQRAVNLTGVDESYDVDDFTKVIKSLTKNQPSFTFFYNHHSPTHHPFHRQYLQNICDSAAKVSPISRLIQQVRSTKSLSEQRLMRKAGLITSHAFTKLMAFSTPGIEESQLEALMEFECRMHGASRLAYPPVVAGGNRANTIHYIENNQRVVAGELVLVDAGCEYHGYSSDITRCWPVNGRFSRAQRDLYEALLEVQQTCIHLCTPNALSLNQMHVIMVTLLGKQLQRLGIVSQSAGEMDVRKTTLQLCPHHLGHYLGMDVHDVDEMSRDAPLKPGTAVTIEPGLYIQRDNTSVSEEWRGVGMRIEDDVIVGDGNDPIVLSNQCPKHPKDIEDVIRGGYDAVA